MPTHDPLILVIAPQDGGRSADLVRDLKSLGMDFRVSRATMLADTPASFNMERAIAFNGWRLRPGEIGCAKSHRNALIDFLASCHDWCLIFEDDARLSGPDALQHFCQLAEPVLLIETPRVVSLYSRGNTITGSGIPRFWKCLAEPWSAVAYAVNRAAAQELAQANEHLSFVSDWPRPTGVEYFLYLPMIVAHDFSLPSLIGDRMQEQIQRPLSQSPFSWEVLRHRMAIYSGATFLRSRKHFTGLADYWRIVLKRRVVTLLGRALLPRTRNRIEGNFILRRNRVV